MPSLLVVYKAYDLQTPNTTSKQVQIDQVPVKKIETPAKDESVVKQEQPDKTVVSDPNKIEDTKPVVEEVELTPSFIDLTKITPEQKVRLRNSVSGIKVDELISKVNNMNDK